MNKKKLGIIAVTVLVLSTLTYLYIPIMAQPGDANDPLVTQRYVDDQIARLEEQIAAELGKAGVPVKGDPRDYIECTNPQGL